MTNLNETIADDSGEWFDGPLLSAKQATELAGVLSSWLKRIKEPAAMSQKTRAKFSNRVVRLDDVASELLFIGLARTNSTISEEIQEFRAISPISVRQVRLLINELRHRARTISRNEDQQ